MLQEFYSVSDYFGTSIEGSTFFDIEPLVSYFLLYSVHIIQWQI